MASSQPLNGTKMGKIDFFDNADLHTMAGYRRLGVLNGVLIGLVIAVSYWLPKILELYRLPIWVSYAGPIGSALTIILLCTLTSWLTARMSRIIFTFVLWLITAVLVTMSLGFMPNLAHNWSIWFLDDRFANLPIMNVPNLNEWWSFAVAGYLLIIAILALAVLQDFRLEKAFGELSDNKRLTIRAFMVLFIPSLLTAVCVYMMPDFLGSAPRHALRMTHQGISEGRQIEGDLFAVSLETGFNYSALNGVIDQIDGEYQLMLGEIDELGSTIVIVANFESGAWINCRVNADYLFAKYFSFCYEAQRPYTIGFSSLITGEPLPENCFGCLPAVDAEWQSWLEERVTLLGDDVTFARIAQQGRFVLAQARSSDGDYAFDCMFEGLEDVSLLYCTEGE